VEPDALLNAVRAGVEKQKSDVALEAAIALLATFIGLIATFIGERVTCKLLHDVWPDVCTHEVKEMPE
jgi:hypothetical protein